MKVCYNDGAAKTEVSSFTQPSERDYVIPPDRIFPIYPVTRLGSKLLDTTGEVTIYQNRIYCADGSLDHFDRVSFVIGASNWGAVQSITAMPLNFEYMILVTDGSVTHLYKVSRNTGPVHIELPEDMTGEQTATSPTMYVEVIFFDTDYGITDGFVDDGAGTLYYAWMQPLVLWLDVFNTVDTGILGGIGFLANIGLSSLFDRLIPMLTGNGQLQQAAQLAKIPLEVIGTSLATAMCLAVYYNWIEIDDFIRNGGFSKLISAVLNPVSVGGTIVSMATGAIENSWSQLISKAAGGASTFMTTQAMLRIVDDIAVEISA
jgi:hypothetical protein